MVVVDRVSAQALQIRKGIPKRTLAGLLSDGQTLMQLSKRAPKGSVTLSNVLTVLAEVQQGVLARQNAEQRAMLAAHMKQRRSVGLVN